MRVRTSPTYLILGCWAYTRGVGCNAFSVDQQLCRTKRNARFQSKMLAKPSKAKFDFDLEAIEAYESLLENQEQESQGSNAGSCVEDSVKLPETHAQILTVPPSLHNKRVDAALAELIDPALSRSVCGNLVLEGRVKRVNGDGSQHEIIDRKSFKVDSGMKLQVQAFADASPKEIVAQKLPLNILFEDEHMIVLNKAAHMVVHPAAGNWDGTVVNALAHYLPRSAHGRGDFLDENGTPITTAVSLDEETEDAHGKGHPVDGEVNTASFRPGIVHRLDKGTTGVLVVAKSSRALTNLSIAFAARQVKKTYLAVTVGNPGSNVKIDKPIGRHPVFRQKYRVVPDPHQRNSRNRLVAPRAIKSTPSQAGRSALSYVDSLAFDGKLALVRVKIETGRTHQIRVHLQDRHTPIYGDDVYGLSDWNKRLSKAQKIDRPLLHAYKLSLCHPITGKQMDFSAPLDPDMMRIASSIVPPGSEKDLSSLLAWD